MESVHADFFSYLENQISVRKMDGEKLPQSRELLALQIQLGMIRLLEEKEKKLILDLKLEIADDAISGISSGTAILRGVWKGVYQSARIAERPPHLNSLCLSFPPITTLPATTEASQPAASHSFTLLRH